MNFLVNDSIIKAVSWTLIHSLWLGLVLALLAGLTVLLTKKSTSAIRYNLLATLSVLFLVTIGLVLRNELKTEEKVSQASQIVKSDFKAENVYTVSAPAVKSVASTPVSVLSTFISDYGSWIVCIWFIVFSFKCFRMMGDLRHVFRVRNYQIISPPVVWQNRLSELKSLLKIKRGVQLLESRLVNVPSVTGFFKPVILVPVGLLNNIPQDQVEAILLHELAHIRRSDYAVNLMQSFMEIMFFFNPGVLWISSLLKDERENCCDDLAISVTNDKKEFVNALVSFQEYNMNAQRFALQFGNQKMNLADRAKRILFNHNKMLSTAEKYFLSVCMAMGTVLFLVIANVNNTSAQEMKSAIHPKQAFPGTVSDTLHANRKYNPKAIPEGTAIKYVDVVDGKEIYTYLFKDNGIFYQVPESMDNFMVNGTLISGDDRNKYLEDINRLIDNYEVAIAESEMEDFLETESQDFSAEERIIDEASRKIDYHSAIIDKQAEIIEKHAKIIENEASKKNINWKKHDEAQRKIEEAHRKIEAESSKINRESREIEAQSRKIEAKLRLQEEVQEAESARFEAESRRVESESRRVEIETRKVNKQTQSFATPPEPSVCSPAPVYQDITEAVIGELRKEGFNGNIRSMELNERKLIINGTAQSAAMFEKVKKYTKPGMRILYNIEIR